MALKLKKIRKLSSLNLSRATAPIISEEEKIKRLEKRLEKWKGKYQARQKYQNPNLG